MNCTSKGVINAIIELHVEAGTVPSGNRRSQFHHLTSVSPATHFGIVLRLHNTVLVS